MIDHRNELMATHSLPPLSSAFLDPDDEREEKGEEEEREREREGEREKDLSSFTKTTRSLLPPLSSHVTLDPRTEKNGQDEMRESERRAWVPEEKNRTETRSKKRNDFRLSLSPFCTLVAGGREMQWHAPGRNDYGGKLVANDRDL